MLLRCKRRTGAAIEMAGALLPMLETEFEGRSGTAPRQVGSLVFSPVQKESVRKKLYSSILSCYTDLHLPMPDSAVVSPMHGSSFKVSLSCRFLLVLSVA